MKSVAVVGCGSIGAAHAAAWQKVSGASLDCCMDNDVENARRLAGETGSVALDNIRALPGSVDIVSVTTPPSTHYEITKYLLENGLHVFCEKPLTMNLTRGEELGRLAEKKKLKLGVGFKMRYEPAFQKAKECAGRLGKIYQVQTYKIQRHAPYADKPWISETGALFELSIHDFDLVHYILGTRPVEILDARFSHRLGWKKPDGFQMHVRYENDAMGSLCGLYTENVVTRQQDFSLTAAGRNGDMLIVRNHGVRLRTDSIEFFEETGRPDTFALELRDFLDCVLTGDPVPIGAREANDATWVALGKPGKR